MTRPTLRGVRVRAAAAVLLPLALGLGACNVAPLRIVSPADLSQAAAGGDGVAGGFGQNADSLHAALFYGSFRTN